MLDTVAAIDLDEFQRLVLARYVVMQRHPETDNLLIWNYSRKTQWDRVWTTETRMARGLITDRQGVILARPFEKFFNLGEHLSYDMPLPIGEPIEVTEKIDGSLGILYPINGSYRIASRGSFTSQQAIKGTELLRREYSDLFPEFRSPEKTYLFEIVYPENRIVVNYGDEAALFLLAIRNTVSGAEVDDSLSYGEFPCPDMHYLRQSDDLYKAAYLLGDDEENREGVVIRFTKSNLRVKMKFNEYVRLHKLMTGLNARDIWECLRRDQSIEKLLVNVPDEFDTWVRQTELRLSAAFVGIATEANRLYDLIRREDLSRPDYAQWVRVQERELHPVLFRLYDGKRYDDIIWRLVKPESGETPFKVEGDDDA